MSEAIRGYYILTEASYYDPKIFTEWAEEIMIGLYDPEGGCDWEWAIRWIDLNDDKLTAQVQVFADAFWAFRGMPDVFSLLAQLHNKNPTKADVLKVLKDCGFTDLTKRG